MSEKMQFFVEKITFPVLLFGSTQIKQIDEMECITTSGRNSHISRDILFRIESLLVGNLVAILTIAMDQ